jgi:urease accessory protein
MQPVVAWQIVDSAFPTGGFAHSGGLEAAARSGEVNGESLRAYLHSSLVQQGYGLLPFVLRAHRSRDRLDDVDERCDAFLTNHVARAASARLGQALVSTAAAVFNREGLRALRDELRDRLRAPPTPGGAIPCHLAPAFGAVTASLGFSGDEAARLYLFVVLRDIASSAIRLGIVGPLAAHAVLHSLGSELERVAAEVVERGPEEPFQTAPLLDIVQSTHHRLYSKLFQS